MNPNMYPNFIEKQMVFWSNENYTRRQKLAKNIITNLNKNGKDTRKAV